jgi:hypothetical protein
MQINFQLFSLCMDNNDALARYLPIAVKEAGGVMKYWD